MMGLMRTKTHRQLLATMAIAFGEIEDSLRALLKDQAREFEEFERRLEDPEARARWSSPDGKLVLNDLQDALRLIKEYQRSLSTILAADPHYREADALLEKWGMKGDPAKVVQGFQQVKAAPIMVEIDKKGKVTDTATLYVERTPEGDKVHLVPKDQEAAWFKARGDEEAPDADEIDDLLGSSDDA